MRATLALMTVTVVARLRRQVVLADRKDAKIEHDSRVFFLQLSALLEKDLCTRDSGRNYRW